MNTSIRLHVKENEGLICDLNRLTVANHKKSCALREKANLVHAVEQSQGLRNLDASGMPHAVQEKLIKMVHQPHGIVLVTGPTGSGKTTTLYGVLQQLNQRNVKILTVEDPVEYRISGINQVQVNDKIQLTFARMLRSFLRQDPDILLVGEVRDSETAEIAARAAMTGHLVLSTLHTNDAASTPGRLLDMGIPGFLIASTLLGVMSQRLLRVICKDCAQAHAITPEETAWLKEYYRGDLGRVTLRKGQGCARCNHTGYLGRTGVFEILEMTDSLATLIHRGDPIAFEDAARRELSGASLEQQALALVVAGETTIHEAMSVVSRAASR